MRGRLGGDPKDTKEIRILNRVVRWTQHGIEYEADQRHAEIVIDTLGLHGAKGAPTPGVKECELTEDEETMLEGAEITLYRALAARLNYLAQDRPDIQYAAKEISRRMSQPRVGDWKAVRRMARYLISHPSNFQIRVARCQ